MADDFELTEQEQHFIDCTRAGDVARFPYPYEGEEETKEQRSQIRAEVIYRLIVDPLDGWKVSHKGISLNGVVITEQLDLGYVGVLYPMSFDACTFEQQLDLSDAHIKTLYMIECTVPEICAQRITVDGSVFIRETIVSGALNFLGGYIGGMLGLDGSAFNNPNGRAINADSLVTGGLVSLRGGFSAVGEVNFVGAIIGSALVAYGGKFFNSGGIALVLSYAKITGTVYLGRNPGKNADNAENPPFEATGIVGLRSAKIGDGMFLNDGFTAKGEVNLMGATVGLDLVRAGGLFENPNGQALRMNRAKIKGCWYWTPRLTPVGEIDTEGAEVGALCDAEASWPRGDKGSYILEGFEYGRIQVGARTDWAFRKAWLDGQKFVGSLFAPQPYEHLVSVLRKTGHPGDARQIAIAKQEALRKSGALSWRGALWNRFLGILIGHGYKPWKALYWMAAVMLLGSVVFYKANSLHVMQPAKERILMEREKPGKSAWVPKDYPEFNPIIYSLDVFLPIVDMHQESYWLPATDIGHWYAGGWFRAYMWLHIALGWIMTTIAVAGLTGIVKKD